MTENQPIRTNMEKELKNCPFCDGKAELHEKGFVYCENCEASTSVKAKEYYNEAWLESCHSDSAEAITAWNTRTSQPTPESKELLGRIESIIEILSNRIKTPDRFQSDESYLSILIDCRTFIENAGKPEVKQFCDGIQLERGTDKYCRVFVQYGKELIEVIKSDADIIGYRVNGDTVQRLVSEHLANTVQKQGEERRQP